MNIQRISTDVIVIGGGGAGARAAIAAIEKGTDVILVSKGLVGRSGSTPLASWGFAAAFGHGDVRDSPEQHFLDTIEEGRFISEQDLVRTLVSNAPERALELESYGLKIKKKTDGKYDQISVPGETYPRSLIIRGGGRRIINVLCRKLHEQGVELLQDTVIVDLLQRDGSIIGAFGLNLREGVFYLIEAPSIILATGGCGYLWQTTDNPSDNIGDGYYLAYHAGASIVDMELILYYPMVIKNPLNAKGTIVDYEVCLDPAFLDGRLINAKGEEFIPLGPLPARDKLVYSIFKEIYEGRGTQHNGVVLDFRLSHKSIKQRRTYAKTMLGAYNHLTELGIDLFNNTVEVAPAVHYTLGGIHIDKNGRTDIGGLFAAGEAAGNIHGANRISGNALAETQVFGKIAGETAAEHALTTKRISPEIDQIDHYMSRILDLLTPKPGKGVHPLKVKNCIRTIMDKHVGFGRSSEGLEKALDKFRKLRCKWLPKMEVLGSKVFNVNLKDAIDCWIMLDVAEIVCLSALKRKESRGHHFRIDYRQPDDNWIAHTRIKKVNGNITLTKAPLRRLR